MFKRILLAYDGSSRAASALSRSAELAKACNAELHILGVAATTGAIARLQAETPYDLFSLERNQVGAALETAADELANEGLRVTTHMLEGDAAEEIIAQTLAIDADLIVIGHDDKGFLARWFLGSTGADLLRMLPCSLLIATGD